MTVHKYSMVRLCASTILDKKLRSCHGDAVSEIKFWQIFFRHILFVLNFCLVWHSWVIGLCMHIESHLESFLTFSPPFWYIFVSALVYALWKPCLIFVIDLASHNLWERISQLFYFSVYFPYTQLHAYVYGTWCFDSYIIKSG